MAIQIRRGSYEDFDPSKLVAGELAVVTEGDPSSSTGRALYICFEPGAVKRIVDYDDIGDEIAQAAGIQIDDLRDVVADAESATTAAETAAQNANTAAQAASQAAGSYVGMIIHSTTLDTQAKVKAQYGGTTWIQHSGYFLYGASSGVTASTENDLHNTADGGEDTHTLTINEMPSHDHGEASLQGEFTSYAWSTGYASGIMRNKGSNVNVQLAGGSDIGQATYGINASHTHSVNGGGQAFSIMPPYKKVYIWERTA